MGNSIIYENGNVGIGTSAPVGLLDVGIATSASTSAGLGNTPPNFSDADYVSGAGQGGNQNADGSNGLVVVIW